MLIQHQSYHGNYACTLSWVALSDGDGIDSNTRVPTFWCAWDPAVLSYHARHLKLLPSTGLVLLAFPDAESPQVRLLEAWVCP
jgi:hypothetical protein